MVARHIAPSQAECEQNAQSIVAIPPDELPDVGALAELVRRAMCGYDVRAYVPAGLQAHVLWVRQRRPDIESRFAPAEWARLWRAGQQPCWQEAATDGEGGAA